MCGPTIIDTDSALALQANALQGIYNLKADAINTALAFDAQSNANRLCFVAGTRYTDAGGTSSHALAGTFGMSYEVNPHVRVGGYIEQALSHHDDGGVDSSADTPLFALFGDWSQSADGTGPMLHLSAGVDQDRLDLTRTVVGSSVAGRGAADLNTYGANAVFSYGMPWQSWLATPFAGLRYTRINRDGYTETTPFPITFDDLTDSAATVLAGLRLSKHISERIAVNGSLGFELDLAHTSGSNHGMSGTAVGAPFNADDNRFRPTASFGGSFMTVPGQDIVAGVSYREGSFSGTRTLDATLGYQIGF